MYENGTYGEAPNDYLVQCIDKFPSSSRILSLGEGEGRKNLILVDKPVVPKWPVCV